MKINNKDLDELGIEVLDYTIGSVEIENRDQWTDGRLTPYLDNQFFKYRPVSLVLLIDRPTDSQAEKDISRLTRLSSQALIEFDNIDIKRKGVLETITSERITPGIHDIEMEFKCEYGITDKVTETLPDGTGQVDVQGTVTTPATVTLTTSESLSNIEITGLGEDLTVDSLEPGQTLVIDGKKGIVELDGNNAFEKYTSWTFPKLEPGINEITTNKTGLTVEIEYITRWL